MSGRKAAPEAEVSELADRCLQRTVLRFVGGVAVGGLFGAMIFRKRAAVSLLVGLGGGVGLGSAYEICQADLRRAEAEGKKFPRLSSVFGAPQSSR